MKLFKSILPLAGSVVGGMFGGPVGAAIGGGIGGALGGGGSKGPGPQQQLAGQSGFATLPKAVQDAYLQRYLPSILSQYNDRYQATPLGQAQGGVFGSNALQDLQNYSKAVGGLYRGTKNVTPIGQIEGFNPYQMQALALLGGGLPSGLAVNLGSAPNASVNKPPQVPSLNAQLQPYMELYNQNILNPQLAEINERNAEMRNQLYANQIASGGLGGLRNSAFGTQLAQQQHNADKLKLDARQQAFGNALNLRNQTLQQMLSAGGAIQGQNQRLVDLSNANLQHTTPEAKSAALGRDLGLFQGTQSSYGYYTPEKRPGMGDNLISGALLGSGFGNQFGGGGGGNPLAGLFGGNQGVGFNTMQNAPNSNFTGPMPQNALGSMFGSLFR